MISCTRQTRRWLTKGAVVATLGLGAVSASAETLADALVGAYTHSGLLEQNRALLRAADEDVAQAAADLLPVVNWQADLERTFGESRGVNFTNQLENTSLSASIVASWQLYDFGADQARIDGLKETVLATRAGLLSLEQQILLRAVSAYFNVRASSQSVVIRQSNIRLLSEELRAARDRFDVGEVTRTDVSLAEAALAAARSDLSAAQGALQQAREEYRVAVGRFPGQLSAPPALPRLERSIDRARRFAVQNHPDLEQASRQVSATELGIVAAKAAMNPVISLQGSLSASSTLENRSGSESASIGLRAQGPIYQGGRLSSLVRQAQAQRDASRNNLHVVEHDVFAAVGNAYADLEAARSQILATEEQIRAARVAFEGIREEAKLGARTTLDVLDAEQQLLDAQASRVTAEANQYIAAYGVLSSMGLLTAQKLGLPVQIYDPSAYYNLVKDGVTQRSRQGQQLDRVLKAISK